MAGAAPESEVRLAQEVRQLLEKIAVQEGFTAPSLDVSNGTKPGDNYIGVVYRVAVTDSDAGGRRDALSLIVKFQPRPEEMHICFDTDLFFEKEAHFYNVVYPTLIEFQREHGVVDEELSPLVPRCYHAGRDAVVLEDMSTRGYRMLDRKRTLDAAHCRLVLRSLARLHALSLALRRARPEEYARLTRDIREGLLVADLQPHLAAHFDASVAAALETFKERRGRGADARDDHVTRLEGFFDGYYEKLLRTVSPEACAPYAVINHGDSWTNNFLFDYEAEQAAPASLCLLDFQAVRHCSPATDVSYFIHHCTDKSLRVAHYDDFIDGYYDSLTDFLERLGCKAVDVFPRSALDDQLHRFSRFALALSTFELPMFTADFVDVGDTALNEEACWRRMGDVFVDMVDRDYVD